MCHVIVVRRRGRREASPPSSSVSYERDDLAVIQYDPTACDNGLTSCSGDRRHGLHYHQRAMSQNLTWPPSDEKLTSPTSTMKRCPQAVGPPCFQDGGQCPLDAASYHCRRCSAALKAISQSVCCSRRAPCPGDVTSGSDVTTSRVRRVTAETEREPDSSGSQDATDSGQSQRQPPRYDQ